MSEPPSGGTVRNTGDDFHYLVHVRRVKAGDSFDALSPEKVPGTILVESVDNGVLTGRFAEKKVPGTNLTPIILFQALPKAAKADLIARQAAECGAAEVVVFVSEHSVAKRAEAGKLERWRRIVREARQQSGSPVETKVRFLPNLAAALDYWKKISDSEKPSAPTAAILLHEAPLENAATFHHYLNDSPALLALAVGPEGGFSAGEVAEFLGAGFKPLRMAGAVLRVETAALAALSAARMVLSERNAWNLNTKN
jgi:16S rRNA (uracil1498-N3)-methyltransferase